MPTILCADDTADIRTLVRATLARDGVRVLVAASGAEALEMMVRERPDAVLLDIHMPVLDGLETLQWIAADPGLADIPVMMLTSDGRAESVRTALARGARDFVVKPFEPRMLRERVTRLLASSQRAPTAAAACAATVPELRLSRRVLIVDDQSTNLEMAIAALSDRFEVVAVRSGAGALAAAAESRPDAIILDLYMPGMDGVQMLARLRQIPVLAGVKVLAAVLGAEDEAALTAGFDGVVRKPFQRESLRSALATVLGPAAPFTFAVHGDVTVLHLHAGESWTQDDRSALMSQTERAFARMIESGQTWFVIDAERLSRANESELRAAAEVGRAVAIRAGECQIDCRLVVPFAIQRVFDCTRRGVWIEMCAGMGAALRSLRRSAERRANRPEPSGGGLRAPVGAPSVAASTTWR